MVCRCPRGGASPSPSRTSPWAWGRAVRVAGRLPPTRDPRDVADHEGEHDGPDGDQDRLGRHGVPRVSESTTQLTSWTSPRSGRGCPCLRTIIPVRTYRQVLRCRCGQPGCHVAHNACWPSGTTGARWPRGFRVEACLRVPRGHATARGRHASRMPVTRAVHRPVRGRWSEDQPCQEAHRVGAGCPAGPCALCRDRHRTGRPGRR